MTEVDKEQIDAWKLEHGDIFMAAGREADYYYRTMTFGEFSRTLEIEELFGSEEAEEYIFKTVLLHPKDIKMDQVSAAVPTTVAQQVLAVSGFIDTEHSSVVLMEERENAQDMKSTVYAFVLSALPMYKVEDLEKMKLREICRMIALAEKVVSFTHQIVGSDGEITIQFGQNVGEEGPTEDSVDPIEAKLMEAMQQFQ